MGVGVLVIDAVVVYELVPDAVVEGELVSDGVVVDVTVYDGVMEGVLRSDAWLESPGTKDGVPDADVGAAVLVAVVVEVLTSDPCGDSSGTKDAVPDGVVVGESVLDPVADGEPVLDRVAEYERLPDVVGVDVLVQVTLAVGDPEGEGADVTVGMPASPLWGKYAVLAHQHSASCPVRDTACQPPHRYTPATLGMDTTAPVPLPYRGKKGAAVSAGAQTQASYETQYALEGGAG